MKREPHPASIYHEFRPTSDMSSVNFQRSILNKVTRISIQRDDKTAAEKRKQNDVLKSMDVQLRDFFTLSKSFFIYQPERSTFHGWKVISVLGTGTFASVYKIVNLETGIIAAAKLLEPHKFCSSTQKRVVELFAKEIKYSVLCQCPGVVRIKQVVRGLEGWMIIQQLLEGGTLWEDYSTSNEFESFCLLLQLIQTIMYIQDRSVVHRDLKPTNILRSVDKSKVYVADFGWSESFCDLNSHLHELPGTIEINPPEVLAHSPDQSYKLDNYALGLNMLLLMGRQFVCRDKNVTPAEAAQKVLNNISAIRAGLPVAGFSSDAWAVFVGLTHFDPMKRLTLIEVIKSRWFIKHVPNIITTLHRRNSVLLWHIAVKTTVDQYWNNYFMSPMIRRGETMSSCSTRGCYEDEEESWETEHRTTTNNQEKNLSKLQSIETTATSTSSNFFKREGEESSFYKELLFMATPKKILHHFL